MSLVIRFESIDCHNFLVSKSEQNSFLFTFHEVLYHKQFWSLCISNEHKRVVNYHFPLLQHVAFLNMYAHFALSQALAFACNMRHLMKNRLSFHCLDLEFVLFFLVY